MTAPTNSTTAIEGNPLTVKQVRAVEEGREIVAIASRSKLEVVNYFAALRHRSGWNPNRQAARITRLIDAVD